MHSRKLLISSALLTCGTLALSTEPSDQTKEQSPKQFVQEWVAALGKNNPKHHMTFYDMDDRLEVIISSGMRLEGYGAVKEAYQKDQEIVRFYDSQAKDITVRRFGDTALVSLDHQFKTRFLSDDSRWQVHIRTTMALRKIDGEWKIVQEHSSPIQGIERYVPLP